MTTRHWSDDEDDTQNELKTPPNNNWIRKTQTQSQKVLHKRGKQQRPADDQVVDTENLNALKEMRRSDKEPKPKSERKRKQTLQPFEYAFMNYFDEMIDDGLLSDGVIAKIQRRCKNYCQEQEEEDVIVIDDK